MVIVVEVVSLVLLTNELCLLKAGENVGLDVASLSVDSPVLLW